MPRVEEVSESEFLGKPSKTSQKKKKGMTRRKTSHADDVSSVSTAASSHSAVLGAATTGLAAAALSKIPRQNGRSMYWGLLAAGWTIATALAVWYIWRRMKRMEDTLNDTLDALLEQEELEEVPSPPMQMEEDEMESEPEPVVPVKHVAYKDPPAPPAKMRGPSKKTKKGSVSSPMASLNLDFDHPSKPSMAMASDGSEDMV